MRKDESRGFSAVGRAEQVIEPAQDQVEQPEIKADEVDWKARSREWEKDGVKRYTTEIVADNIQLLGRRPDQNSENPATPSVASTGVVEAEAPIASAEGDDLPF